MQISSKWDYLSMKFGKIQNSEMEEIYAIHWVIRFSFPGQCILFKITQRDENHLLHYGMSKIFYSKRENFFTGFVSSVIIKRYTNLLKNKAMFKIILHLNFREKWFLFLSKESVNINNNINI